MRQYEKSLNYLYDRTGDGIGEEWGECNVINTVEYIDIDPEG